MESDKDIHSYFWERMQEAVGVLPKHLMRILNLQGYSSCDALAEVKDSDVTQIQSDMRLLAPVKKACLGTDEMRNLYGQFATSPESFIFLNGERKAILKIAEVVRKYGIHHFLPGTSGKACTDFRPSAKSSDLADVLLRKIKTYYESRRVDTIDFACFFAKLDGLTATVSIQEDGSAIGMVTCKMCKPEKTVKLKKTPMGTWLLGNFVKHSSQYHYCVRNSKPNMKRNSAEIVTSTPKKKNKEPSLMETDASTISESNTTNMSESHLFLDSAEARDETDAECNEICNSCWEDYSSQERTLSTNRISIHLNLSMDGPCLENSELSGFCEDHSSEERTSTKNRSSDDLGLAPGAPGLGGSIRPSSSEDNSSQEKTSQVNRLVNRSPNTLGIAQRDHSSPRLSQGRPSPANLVSNALGGSVVDSLACNHICEGCSRQSLANCSTSTQNAPVLESLINIHNKSKDIKPQARRFTNSDKDIGTYEFLAAGKSHFTYHGRNSTIMSVKTIQRHLKQNTKNVVEGSVDVFGLKKYLIDNEFPLAVCLCEDGTRITAGVQYDYTTDSLRGLVAPLNENGLPQTGLFTASSPYKIAQMIKDYPTGNHVYVQMALPLAAGAAPFVLYHACSDNKFDATDVLNRWRYTEMVLREQGINVVANASDGDPRLMKAMKERSCLRNNYSKSTWGWWYSIEDENNSVLNVQDMIHGINKIRNRLMRGDLKIGKFKVSTSHLKELIQNHSKDKHRLSMSDIDLKDKMKFGPSLKMIDKDMINYLKQHVRQSSGTVLLLNVMRLMHNSFVDENFVPLDRVHDVWTATFIIRAWRNWCKRRHGNLKSCITTNAYMSLELNAHALLAFMKYCIDNNTPEQFLISCLSSQPCEDLFRQLRSMAPVEQTIVNFNIKELSEKLKRLQMKTNIMYRHSNSINFPAMARHHGPRVPVVSLPTIEEIKNTVKKAMDSARSELLSVGIEGDEVNFQPSINVQSGKGYYEFECNEDSDSDEETGGNVDVEFVTIDEMESDDGDEAFINEVNEIDVRNEMEEVLETVTNRTEINEEVFDADTIFPNFEGKLNLKSTTVGNKHTFKIADSSGAIKNIKKSTLIWMMTEGQYRLSSDRIRRFAQRERSH